MNSSQLTQLNEVRNSLLECQKGETSSGCAVENFVKAGTEDITAFSDFQIIDDTHLWFVVGQLELENDAIIENATAALLYITTLINTFRALSEHSDSVSNIATLLNNKINKSSQLKSLLTIGLLNIKTGELTYFSNGLTPAILSNENIVFSQTSDIVFGKDKTNMLATNSLQLSTDAIFCFYTMTLPKTIAPNNVNDFLANEEKVNLENIRNNIIDKIYKTKTELKIDIAFLLVQWKPQTIEITNRLSVHFKNDISEINKLHKVVEIFAGANSLTEKIQMNINLVLEELISNIIFYGYEDHEDHLIYVHFMVEDEKLTALIEDDAKAFNPLEAPEVDVDTLLDDKPVGGLGIHFVKTLMDELSYERIDNKNTLKLVCKI